jgi:hypothetical protein
VQSRPADYDGGAFIREMHVEIDATDAQKETFFAFLTSQIGKPYDALAIVSFAAGRDWQAPDSWFCSELQAAALAACGLFPERLAVGFSHITPRDLLLLVGAMGGRNV